jgi:hypothetical protein
MRLKKESSQYRVQKNPVQYQHNTRFNATTTLAQSVKRIREADAAIGFVNGQYRCSLKVFYISERKAEKKHGDYGERV